ncbi:MAG: hypothetical protein IT292_04825 [Deltaproteobacteria bacterium]|nr:hypothetical protein [Deltaproteobacteria bacterium]
MKRPRISFHKNQYELMNRLLSILLVLLVGAAAAVILICSFDSLRLGSALVKLQQTYSILSGEIVLPDLKGKEQRTEEFLERATAVNKDNSSAQAKYRLSQAQFLSSRGTVDHIQKSLQLCSALKSIEDAQKFSPANSNYQILAINILTTISHEKFSCPDKTSDLLITQLHQAIAHAEKLAPASPAALLALSQANLELGNKLQALQSLRRLQLLGSTLSEQEQLYIFNLPDNSEELALLLPTTYPAFLPWIQYFSQVRSTDFSRWNDTFARALLQALLDLEQRLDKNKIGEEDYIRFILDIANLDYALENNEARKKLDTIMANIFGRNNNLTWSNILNQRKDMVRIPILKAGMELDKAPEASMLSSWLDDTSKESIAFNKNNSALGFYLPENYLPQLIILEAAERQKNISAESIALYASSDNQAYYPYKQDAQIQSLSLADRHYIVISIKQPTFRYFKILYSNSMGDGSFRQRLTRLVQVYGTQIKQ